MIVRHLKQLSRHAALTTSIGLLCALPSAFSQSVQSEPGVTLEAWRSERTTQILGLPEVKPNTKGSLSLSATALIFTSEAGNTSIDRSKLLSVTAGSERRESGGTAGKISRAVIPFGGGSLMAATATNKEVGLLTVEFRDDHGALHGAVFQLPKADAFQAEQLFGKPSLTSLVAHPDITCEAPGPAKLNVVHVELPVVEGIIVPAEYRALIYEQVITKLREENTFSAVYRDGDVALASACPDYKLTLTLKAFTKGNAALRASTGPVGFFVGATSFRVHVSVQSRSGSRLIDKEMKVSQRGDSESLNVADKIGKSLNKELKKLSQHDPIRTVIGPERIHEGGSA